MTVNPGELNKKIQIIEKKFGRKDKDGFPKTKENLVREPYAKVTRKSCMEQMKAETEINIMRCRFLIRYSDVVITRKMFVKYNEVYYQIEYVNNYEDGNEYIELIATAGVK